MESKIYDTLQWQVRSQLGGRGLGSAGCGLLEVILLCHFLHPQIWTLLPGFCTKPTDVATSFKGLARTLGMAISERPDLRVTVCQALRTLITKSCEAGVWARAGLVGGWLRWHETPNPHLWSAGAHCLSHRSAFARTWGFCWGPKDTKNCSFSLFTPNVLTAGQLSSQY